MKLRDFFRALALAASVTFITGCGGGNDAPPAATMGGNANEAASQPEVVQLNSPFPESAYRAKLSLENPPATLKAGQKGPVQVTVRNASSLDWLVYGTTNEGNKYRVAVGNRWLDNSGELITDMDGRYGLPADLKAGEEVTVPLLITVPNKPGDYILELDLVHEGVTWFRDKGSEPLRVNLKVER